MPVSNPKLPAAMELRVTPTVTLPLCLLALSMLYVVFFMVFKMHNSEDYRHGTRPYSRFQYSSNLDLGFGGLASFCIGYMVNAT